MYERFTDRARKVIQLANEEVRRLNHEYIGSEHILLGLIEEDTGVAANVLKNLAIDVRKISREIEQICSVLDGFQTTAKLLPTPRLKKIIENSIEEAHNCNHTYVGTEHILLGVLRDQDGVAAQVLINLGLKLEDVRVEVLNLLGHNAEQYEANRPNATSTITSEDLSHLLPEIANSVNALAVQIEHLTRAKEMAVAAADFDKAAYLRDQVDRLRKVRQQMICSAPPS
jgi:ATP-dependent Clp protease ATP-binding subunit ClpC